MLYILEKIKNRILEKKYSHYYAQEGEDIILARIFDRKNSGFFVDIGAHHPTRFSNTYYFYKNLNWAGINVEPNPDAIQLFRLQRPRDINLNLGVASKNATLEFYQFDEPALNTFSKSMFEERLSHTPYKHVGTKNVQVSPLSEILAHNLPKNTKIDFMTIDVEGLDLEVLESNDWKLYRPDWVLVEELNLDNIENLDFKIHNFMKTKNYVLFAKTYNTLFYKNRELA
ncbi:FkbM family methyltransferase [Methylophilus sp. UBA6697]|uniref:FkbM family methyltransferase n=1 Tax=Methylophilus sp. UBA6697 TaxID=1946902 RepID=UPI0025E0C889|nr:FkbM family methyltransferase [Methylophilus sp. UBA6697]